MSVSDPKYRLRFTHHRQVSPMNAVLINISAEWEGRLCEVLARRGHTFTIVHDQREFGDAFDREDYSLAFVGIDKTIDDAIQVCRQLCAGKTAKPLRIFACGDFPQSEQIRTLVSAGFNEYLTNSDSAEQIELRLALCEQKIPDFLSNGNEVTARKQADDRLRENEALLRGLFENLPDLVLLVDRNIKIYFANHDAAGFSKTDLVGMDGFAYIHPAFQPLCREAFDKAMETGNVQNVEVMDVFGRFWSSQVVPFEKHHADQRAMVICTDITEQKKADEAIQKEQQLLRRIIDLHERERQLTACEIHDSIAQQTTSSLLHLEAFRRLRDCDANKAEHSLEIAVKLISLIADEARRLISGLHPLILDEYGIVEAIDYLINECSTRSGKQFTFYHDVHFNRLAPPLESAVFRIVQEAIANACRHSQSEVIHLELVDRDDRLHIKISDQGVGFDLNVMDETHFGLRSIRERARLLGGQAEIQSAPGAGTCIIVELPVVRQTEDQ